MFVVSIPPKEHMMDQPGPPTKSYYVINTFVSQTPDNVNKAIDYYYEKYRMFISLANQKLNTQILNQINGTLSIEQMFQNAYDTYNTQVAVNWQNLQKQDSKTLQTKIQNFNTYTKQLTARGQQFIQLRDFLAYMNEGTIDNYDQIPGAINLSTIQTLIQSFISAPGDSPQSLGAHRSRLFGEIFEQATQSLIQDSTQYLLGYMQTGGEKSLLPSGRVAQGKSDGMFFIDTKMDGGLITQTIPGSKASYAVTSQHNIPLEVSTLFDVTGGINQVLNQYTALGSIQGGMLGVSNKAQVGNLSSFGSFAPSAQIIKNREPHIGAKKISQYFHYQEDFKDYASYIVSKYLINIIGVYNGIISTGNEMMPTYLWLEQLYNSFRTIRHSIDLGSSKESASSGAKYSVHNKLVISKVK